MKSFTFVLKIWEKATQKFFRLSIHIWIGLVFTGFACVYLSGTSFAEDRLVVKDASGNATFRVEDTGFTHTNAYYLAQFRAPGLWLDETGEGNKGAFFVLDNNWVQIQRRGQGFGDYEASPVFINIDAPNRSIYVAPNGYVGLGAFPDYPLKMTSGAHVTVGGVWTNASSREYKQDIKTLTKEEAVEALTALQPVQFTYKADPKERHVGFIAEDVPDLVASTDRKGMSSMDVVAVLTKVVQDQQKSIVELSRKIAELEKK